MATRLDRLVARIRFNIKVSLLVLMVYIALCKVFLLKSNLDVFCIVTKSMITVFIYSNRAFTKITKKLCYVYNSLTHNIEWYREEQ